MKVEWAFGLMVSPRRGAQAAAPSALHLHFGSIDPQLLVDVLAEATEGSGRALALSVVSTH
eukprot:9495401-Pyramimonas_sp.AAC.1